MKHTKGPWYHDEAYGLIVANRGEIEICALHSGNKANADLISAAPEMLEALEISLIRLDWFIRSTVWHSVELYNEINRERLKIESSIYKARGVK